MKSTESETIEASLQNIRYRGDNNFIIARFKDRYDDDLAAMGNIINPQIGMSYMFVGEYEVDKKYGLQFKFSSYQTVMPINKKGIFNYIVKVCKYVGPVIGNALLDRYGDDTLSILKADPQKITNEIIGLSFDKAKSIRESLLQNEINELIMIQLADLLDVPGMYKNIPGKLIEEYGDQAFEVIKFNPYRLTQFSGIGFLLADLVALKNGIDKNSIERKKACILHCFKDHMQNTGNIWVAAVDLIELVRGFIMVPKIEHGITALKDEGTLIITDDNISLFDAANDEELIAKKILELL